MRGWRALALGRDWEPAAKCYARALECGPKDQGHIWFEYAALLLLAGDGPEYTKACLHLIEACGKEGGPRP